MVGYGGYDLAHQIRCAKHTFRGRCDITPMVCCSFGGHSHHSFYSDIRLSTETNDKREARLDRMSANQHIRLSSETND